MHTIFAVRQHPASLRQGRVGGFSLIELMVAMAISLLLLSGVVAIFLSSRASYETTDRLSRIQETGRFALDQVVDDVRAAGFVGCARAPTYVSNVLTTGTTDVKWNFQDGGLRGFQYVSPGVYTPVIAPMIVAADIPSAANGSDVLLVRRPKRDSQPLRLLVDMGASTANLTVPNVTTSGLATNDIALIYSCEAQTYFQVRSFVGGVITHGPGGAAAETATTSAAPGNVAGTGDLNFSYRRNAEVVPIETVIYYIRASTAGPAGSTSLWRKIGANTAEELVEGVEQMQLRFGVDTTSDGIVDGPYVTANAVANWSNVFSVEIGLLVRSLDGYGMDRDQETYQLLDVAVPAANDNRIREMFTTTTGIRNRLRVN